MKKCDTCGEHKENSEFHKLSSSKDGLQKRCKSCIKQYNQLRYQSKRAEIRAAQSQYLKENREKVLSQKQTSYAKHREEILERRKKAWEKKKEEGKITQWREKNPEAYKVWAREYRAANRAHINELKRQYAAENKEKIKEQQRASYAKHKTSRKQRAKLSFAKHGKKWTQAQIQRRRTNPLERLKHTLRNRTRQALLGKAKPSTTENLLGCSWEQARAHLESQFREGMSWDNYGYKGWHVDHIRPIASFDLTKEEEVRAAFHWSNLQPLWAEENLAKGARTP